MPRGSIPPSAVGSEQRDGGRMTQRYDGAQTPYARVLAAPAVAKADKEWVRTEYLTHTPVASRREIEAAHEALW